MGTFTTQTEYNERLNICHSICSPNNILQFRLLPTPEVKSAMVEYWSQGINMDYPVEDNIPTWVCMHCGCAVEQRALNTDNLCPIGLW